MHLTTATTRSGATVDSWHSFNADSSVGKSVDSGDGLPIRVEETPSHTLALPLGALRVSGGLLEFLWDADHQTLGEVLGEALTQSYIISRQDYKLR